MKKEKQSACKPGSVPRMKRSACHLSTPCVTVGSIVLPSGSGGPPLFVAPVYANFQLPECTARMSPSGRWALTPFTLTVLADGGSFLLHALTLADYFPLRSGMPCVARTFLSRPKPAAASRPTALMSQKYFFFSS